MTGVTTQTVKSDEAGMRLDRWFRAHFPTLTHGKLEKLLRKGEVRVDGGRAKSNRRLEEGETIRIPPLPEVDTKPDQRAGSTARPTPAQVKELKSYILYEDDAIIAVNKPFGLPVQGGVKTGKHLDAMLAGLTKGDVRPRLVHRLDKDTGGLMLVARTRKAANRLADAFKNRQVEKTYWALTAGAPRPREGEIVLPIAKRMVRFGDGAEERIVPAEGEDSKKAITQIQTLDEAGQGVAFLALRPITGRKHQLRVHMAAIGCPIIGDGKYGGPDAHLEGLPTKLHLYCRSMTFAHPTTGEIMTLTAPLSGHMRETWAFFGFDDEAECNWPEHEA